MENIINNIRDYFSNRFHLLSTTACFILIVSGILFTLGLEDTLDIYWNDEGYYLFAGRFLLSGDFPAWFGILYSFWYWILNIFNNDPVSLYYLNYKLLTIIAPVIFFILLRSYKVNTLVSFILGLTFLISTHNVTVWPKVSHFTIIIISIMLIIITNLKRTESRLFISLTGVLFLMYIRPEFILTFFALIILFIYFYYQNSINRALTLKYVSIFFAIAICSVLYFGVPFSFERSFVAFKQHFAYVEFLRFGGDFYPWLDYEIVINENFPGAGSLFESMMINPAALINHIYYNAQSYLFHLSEGVAEILIPGKILTVPLSVKALLLFGLFFIFVYILKTKNLLTDFTGRIKANLSSNKFVIHLITLLFVPSFVASFIYYPRNHYLIIQIYLIILVFAFILFANQGFISKKRSYGLMALIIVLYSLVNPKAADYFTGNKMYVKQTIEYLTNLDIKKQVNLLDKGERLIYFLPENYTNYDIDNRKISLSEFFEVNDINMIYLSHKILHSKVNRQDNEWQEFIDDYHSYGFAKHDLGIGNPILIKSELLRE